MNPELGPAEGADVRSKSVMLCRITFLSLAVIGSLLFYYYQETTAGGLGLSTSLFALVSFFHFNKSVSRQSKMIDTKMTWFFLVICILGLILMISNKATGGPDFYLGITGGMMFMGGLAYGMELLFTWLDNVK